MMNGFYYGDLFGWSFGHGIGMVFFWAAIIWFLVWIVRNAGESGRKDSSAKKTALEILNERYAKGEIDKHEYEAKKKDIQS